MDETYNQLKELEKSAKSNRIIKKIIAEQKNYEDCSKCYKTHDCKTLCKDHPDHSEKKDFFDELNEFEESQDEE